MRLRKAMPVRLGLLGARAHSGAYAAGGQLNDRHHNQWTAPGAGKQYVSVLSGIGGWLGPPVTAGLDLNDKFGAIDATAMTEATDLSINNEEHSYPGQVSAIMSERTDTSPSPPSDGFQDPDDETALRIGLEDVPRGAFAVAGSAVLLLLLAWLFVYFCVFLPRGPVS